MNQFGYALEREESVYNEELWGKHSLVYCLAMDVVNDSEQGEVRSEFLNSRISFICHGKFCPFQYRLLHII
jgi:hypothetical protein